MDKRICRVKTITRFQFSFLTIYMSRKSKEMLFLDVKTTSNGYEASGVAVEVENTHPNQFAVITSIKLGLYGAGTTHNIGVFAQQPQYVLSFLWNFPK